ncbi:MAG TPA: hypothetical protein VNK49_03070 [Anaerolineales bacterium]|nr:hypothetical protein [Anaerolineales bacterium]
MADLPNFDLQQAHRFFSTECFNKTWDNIEKNGNRSIEENMEMLHTAIASLWHWTQRQDASPENLSIGYWQVSRVYNLIKQPHNARTYGLLALKYANGLSPFLKAYAHETLARAEMLAGNRVIMRVHLEKAYELAEQIENEEEKQLLLKDLETIK